MIFSVPAMLAGAGVGAGVAMMVSGWFGDEPDPPEAAGQPTRNGPVPAPRRPPTTAPTPSTSSRLGGWARHAATRLAATGTDLRSLPLTKALRVNRRLADLAMLEEPLELFLVHKIAAALAGLLTPSILAGLAAVVGVRSDVATSALAGAVLAVLASFLPDVRVRARAAAARLEFRRAVCAFLDLTALERAADAGAVEAVERTAMISDAPPFLRIRRALARAQLEGASPWQGLRDLADTTGVVELGDLADIMASSGQGGAAVCASLRARASALRAALASAETAAANTRSEYMVIPVAVLGLIFMALMAYPAVISLTTVG